MNALPPADLAPCDATIAICTYNRISTLPRTLAALERLRGPHRFEVIVVNGPSTDGTGEYLAARTDLRVLTNPDVNLAISRNIAIANAAGRYVAFIDDDAVPEPDWLTLAIDRMDAAPDLAAVGGFIRDADGIGFQARYVFCDVFGTGYPCDNPDYATFPGRQTRLYPSLTGTNVIFRRSAVTELSGFDEAFAYFLDETDVNKRMADAGMAMEVLPAAEIHHKYAPSHLRTSARVSTDMYPIARSIAYFALRHGAPEAGWEAVAERLKAFYRAETEWKQQMVTAGTIDRERFDTLMLQVGRGIRDGIDRHFDVPPDDPATTDRVTRHRAPGAPVVRRMRAADNTLRLCLMSQDHARADCGGIGRWTRLAARELAARGNEVTVIGDARAGQREHCDFTDGGFWSHNLSHFEREAGSETDTLGLPPGLANAARRKLAEVRRVMPRRGFQVIGSPIWDVEGAASIAWGGVPTVLSLHTCAGLMLPSKPEWKADETYYRGHVLKVINAEIQALRHAGMVLANSKAVLDDIGALYGLDLEARPHAIVPHGVEDIAAPEGLLEAREARREAEGGPVRVLFLGRLESRKGIRHLVDAARSVLDAGRDVRFDLIGNAVEPGLRALVERLVEAHPDRVTWHGYLDDAAVDALFRRADVFLAPSTYESFGLIYAEAMRYSVPSVGFATGGVVEVVEDGTDGLLAPLGDQPALNAALDRLVTDSDLRRRLSRAARHSFETKFGAPLMAERLEAVYREAAAGPG